MKSVLFDYQYNYKCPSIVCTKELFHTACKSANVRKRIMNFRATGDDSFKTGKSGLPGVMWQAHYEEGRRLNDKAEFSGLFMLDVDHIENPLEIFNSWWKAKDFDELGIVLVFITPSGKGLKVVAHMRERAGVPNTIPAHQKWLSEQLELKEYDACTKDLARMAFVPLDEDILYEFPELWEIDALVEQLDEEVESATDSPSPSKELTDYDSSTSVKGDFAIGGRPMVDYVLGWFTANGGFPEQGQRNNTIYRCALYFRNFTDYNPKVLAENIPSFGLSDAEMLQVCKSACSAQRAKYWPRNIAELLDETEEADETGEEVSSLDDTPPVMPSLIEFFVQHHDERFKAASVLAMLPILGGLGTDVRATFPDGETHSLSFMSVIIAPQASGKSYARRIWRTLTQRLHEEDAVSWEAERLWRDTLKESARDFKKVDGATKDPEVVIRLIPSKITEPQFFRRLHYAKGKHLLGFYEEIDSLLKEAKGGSYDDKRDLFREAFDNAEHGRDVANVESFSGMEKIYYNFVALGTPDRVMAFYNNAEDGLVSRTIFYQLPVGVFDAMPQHAPISSAESAIVREMADYLIDIKQKQPELVNSDGKVEIPTEEYIDPIWRDWRQMAELRAIKNGSEAEGILLKRASVIAWRATVLYWILWGLQIDEVTLKNLRDDFFWTADIVLREQLALFGKQLQAVQTMRVNTPKRKTFFDLLPDVFSIDDCCKLDGGKRRSAIRSYISRWWRSGLVERISKSTYKKI